MKEMYLKSIRAIRFLFYRHLNINEQLEIANVLENENYLNLFWKLNQADRQHSFEVLNRTKQFSNEKVVFAKSQGVLSRVELVGNSTCLEFSKKAENQFWFCLKKFRFSFQICERLKTNDLEPFQVRQLIHEALLRT